MAEAPAVAEASSAGKQRGGGESAVAGPMLPASESKRKYTAADAKAKKRQKWLRDERPRKLTENERVAMGAGSGSGCFGPGFD